MTVPARELLADGEPSEAAVFAAEVLVTAMGQDELRDLERMLAYSLARPKPAVGPVTMYAFRSDGIWHSFSYATGGVPGIDRSQVRVAGLHDNRPQSEQVVRRIEQ